MKQMRVCLAYNGWASRWTTYFSGPRVPGRSLMLTYILVEVQGALHVKNQSPKVR